jgi:hypothetical protein
VAGAEGTGIEVVGVAVVGVAVVGVILVGADGVAVVGVVLAGADTVIRIPTWLSSTKIGAPRIPKNANDAVAMYVLVVALDTEQHP